MTLAVDLPAATHPFGIATLKGRTLGPLATLFIERARSLSKRLMVRPSYEVMNDRFWRLADVSPRRPK